jgi:hypothetical protein
MSLLILDIELCFWSVIVTSGILSFYLFFRALFSFFSFLAYFYSYVLLGLGTDLSRFTFFSFFTLGLIGLIGLNLDFDFEEELLELLELLLELELDEDDLLIFNY